MNGTATGNPPTGFPASIEIDGVLLYESEDSPGMWFYVPGAPQPELVNGKPSIQLYASRSGGILQLGSRWTIDPALAEALKKRLEKMAGSGVVLQPAPVSIQQVAVESGDGSGRFQTVATSKSSGFPPYAAIFRISLSEEGKMQATAALHGNKGLLSVRYTGSGSVKVAAQAVIEGDVSRAADQLTAGSTKTEIRDWMRRALESRALRMEISGADPDQDISKKARALAEEQFVDALQARLRGPLSAIAGESTLRIEASASEIVQRPLDRRADISDWFPAGNGKDFITVT